MTAYYNEFDPGKAAWLRALIAESVIAPGEVDDRSIVDVRADDLTGFRQCHFFAGIGVWSYALRLAGWPDDRPVWTGSCPCQPFSVAGKRAGFADVRHLAPAWLDLVRECAPVAVFGEQVPGAVREGWLDALQDELERDGYAVGSVTFPACGVGAPHIRQRLYFGAVRAADADTQRERPDRDAAQAGNPSGSCENSGLADSLSAGLEGFARHGDDRNQPGRVKAHTVGHAAAGGAASGLADADDRKRRGIADAGAGDVADGAQAGRDQGDGGAARDCGAGGMGDGERPGPTNGFWRDADRLFCRDGKWRPVEPGTFPLANGAAARVLRLRGYGDGIVAPQAAAFIAAFDAAARECGL